MDICILHKSLTKISGAEKNNFIKYAESALSSSLDITTFCKKQSNTFIN